jgi:hypothetical protein
MKSSSAGRFWESEVEGGVEMDGRVETREWIQWAVVRVLMVSWEEVEEERAMIEQVRKRMSSRMSAAALLMPRVSKMSMKRTFDVIRGDSMAVG